MKIVVFLALVTLAAAIAPLLNHGLPSTVPDQYIIILHENSTELMRDGHVDRLTASGQKILNTYHIGDLIGFSARLDKDALAELLLHPDVKYIECDAIVTAVQSDTITQPNSPSWGLERVCKRQLPRPFNGEYTYWSVAGDGTNSYIIDTGILTTHVDFQGRAFLGANFVTNEQNVDCNGHGTHVASTVGGILYGVAKKTSLWAVKVLGCSGSGTWEGVIAGVNWVTNHYNSNGKRPSVANMSLGGGASPTVDSAVTNSIAAGVHYAIAAGNNAGNACSYSPARVATANGVGATTNTDARASFSNFGTCVSVFAPGNQITGAWIGSNTATNTISGTSMAAPHVAGYIVAYMARNPAGDHSPAAVKAHITQVATKGLVTNPGTGSPNDLLYSLE